MVQFDSCYALIVQDMSIERDALQSKLRRLEHEITELRSTDSSGDVDLIQLRTIKHDLERKLSEQEDELADMHQEAHDLEMVSQFVVVTSLANLSFTS